MGLEELTWFCPLQVADLFPSAEVLGVDLSPIQYVIRSFVLRDKSVLLYTGSIHLT